ncbi:MAG: S8 family serine peptidase [Candidatus Sericytochromatia bacterium]|nr:S8 family serine peptidase [Candidatus Sericytochromatia bacterium]
MRRTLSVALLTGVLSSCGTVPTITPQVRQQQGAGVRSVPHRLIVNWRNSSVAPSLLARLRITRRDKLGLSTSSLEMLEVAPGVDASEFLKLAGDAAMWAEPDYILQLPETPHDAGEGPELPLGVVQSQFQTQAASASKRWWLDKVRVPEAWKVTQGRSDVRIAVVDTGVDPEHPALRSQLVGSWRSAGVLGRVGLSAARDDNGHGTHCAGIAVAAGGDAGVVGVAPGCKLLSVKALDKQGAGATSDIVRGIRWAVAQKARVLSLSVGGEEKSRAMQRAIADALQAGVVVVAAMGNEGKELKNFPAAYPGVIAVAATNRQDKPAGFSTRGAWVSVSAPGVGIWSAAPTYRVTLSRGGEKDFGLREGKLSGTSMATPIVAGLAGLMLSANPRLKPAQVKSAIEKHVRRLGDGFNVRTGHGRVDAAAAVGAIVKN